MVLLMGERDVHQQRALGSWLSSVWSAPRRGEMWFRSAQQFLARLGLGSERLICEAEAINVVFLSSVDDNSIKGCYGK